MPSFAVPFSWNTTNTYQKDEVVYNSGKTYTALQAVPANTAITNTSYWVETGARIGAIDANASDIDTLETNVTNIEGDIDNIMISLYTPSASS